MATNQYMYPKEVDDESPCAFCYAQGQNSSADENARKANRHMVFGVLYMLLGFLKLVVALCLDYSYLSAAIKPLAIASAILWLIVSIIHFIRACLLQPSRTTDIGTANPAYANAHPTAFAQTLPPKQPSYAPTMGTSPSAYP
ncbi:hypothetical protein AAVH_29782 [Aphelenchoides avenae]|nr:hypothetical protein AAVH_29782 [Aphelenchus avenae]